jgi:hypothetical protein
MADPERTPSQMQTPAPSVAPSLVSSPAPGALDYADPTANPAPAGLRRWAQILLGIIAVVAALVGGYWGYFLPYELSPYRSTYFRLWYIGQPPPDAARVDKLAWIGPSLALAALVVITCFVVTRWRWRGFLVGVLFTVLILGVMSGVAAVAIYLTF